MSVPLRPPGKSCRSPIVTSERVAQLLIGRRRLVQSYLLEDGELWQQYGRMNPAVESEIWEESWSWD